VLSLPELILVIESCYTDVSGLTPEAALVEYCCDWCRYLTGSGNYEDPEILVPVEETMVDESALEQELFRATPLFNDIANTSWYHQFKVSANGKGQVIVQARTHAEPRKVWEPKDGIVVLNRTPEEKCPYIIQPKAFKDDDWKALQAVSATFKKSGNVEYHSRPDIQQFWADQEQKQRDLIENGLQPADSAPQDFYRVLVPHSSYGKLLHILLLKSNEETSWFDIFQVKHDFCQKSCNRVSITLRVFLLNKQDLLINLVDNINLISFRTLQTKKVGLIFFKFTLISFRSLQTKGFVLIFSILT
jgi:hypothetical protein